MAVLGENFKYLVPNTAFRAYITWRVAIWYAVVEVKTTYSVINGEKMSNQRTANELLESIYTKALHLDSVSLVAQAGNVEELSQEETENLFGLFSSLSKEISCLAIQAMSKEEMNA